MGLCAETNSSADPFSFFPPLSLATRVKRSKHGSQSSPKEERPSNHLPGSWERPLTLAAHAGQLEGGLYVSLRSF